MADLTALLDRHYYVTINQQEDWAFFRSLVDYIQFIEDTPEIEKIADKYNHQSAQDRKKFLELDEKVLLETEEAKKNLDKIIKSKRISYKELRPLLTEYDNWFNKKSVSTNSHTDNVFQALCDVVRSLVLHGYKDLLKDFATTIFLEQKDLVEKFIFAASLEEREKERYYLKEKEATQLWGDWERLSLAYFVIVKGNDHWESLRNAVINKTSQNGKAQLEMLGFAGVKGEMNKIKDGSKEARHLFVRRNYESSLSRIHTNLVAQLNKAIAKEVKEVKSKQKIKKITFITKPPRDNPTYIFYINNDMEQTAHLRRDSSRIKKFIAYLNGKQLLFDKDLMDYLNSNPKCVLYCNGLYETTRIIERQGEHLKLASGIQARVISETSYKKEINKKHKA